MVERPKCNCGSVECGLVHIPEIGYQCGNCIIKTYTKVDKLSTGCQLTLDLHSGRQWDDAEAERWEEKTGIKEATTRVLCDTIRRLMNEL